MYKMDNLYIYIYIYIFIYLMDIFLKFHMKFLIFIYFTNPECLYFLFVIMPLQNA